MFFSEEPRILVEVLEENEKRCIDVFESKGVRCERLGWCIPAPLPNPDLKCSSSDSERTGECTIAPYVILKEHSNIVLEIPLNSVRAMWEETSVALESLQCDVDCVREELHSLFPPAHFDPRALYRVGPAVLEIAVPRPVADAAISVAVIREEGSNGDREMCEAFFLAGFRVWDVCMQDLLDGSVAIDERFRGVAFVGGFSYADVFGSAKGWAAGVLLNARLRAQFNAFRSRTDTFSLGVCNGCQLMALLGWIDPVSSSTTSTSTSSDLHNSKTITPSPQVFLGQNRSGRFESRFSSVSIERSKSVLLAGLEGSRLGVWVAHGEGRFAFRSSDALSALVANSQVALRFVDLLAQQDAQRAAAGVYVYDAGTDAYPANPNGSPQGIAGLCSPCGRHLALMPHPERAVFAYQWAYLPRRFERTLEHLQPQHSAALSQRAVPEASNSGRLDGELRPGDLLTPWFCMFRNAYTWCEQQEITRC